MSRSQAQQQQQQPAAGQAVADNCDSSSIAIGKDIECRRRGQRGRALIRQSRSPWSAGMAIRPMCWIMIWRKEACEVVKVSVTQTNEAREVADSFGSPRPRQRQRHLEMCTRPCHSGATMNLRAAGGRSDCELSDLYITAIDSAAD